jgi:sialate O-acetylesterase
MQHRLFGTLTLALLGWITATAADTASLPFVSPIFSDNMVLQRGKPNTIWGWSKPGQAVRVEIAGHLAKTVTGADGHWQVRIHPPAPGGHYTIKIDGPQHEELRGVLVGDVWLCGGQSNMQLGLARTRNGADEIKSANQSALTPARLTRCPWDLRIGPSSRPSCIGACFSRWLR